jgi:exopolysaccharide biosynthesis polyprenyl glycosylphosphotransferase
MQMLTSTIKDSTTRVEAASSTGRTSLRVRLFAMPSPRGVFIAAELALLGAVVIAAVRHSATFGTSILIGCCALAVYLKAVDRSIVHSSRARFWRDLGEALCWGTGAGMLILHFFPILGSGTAAALAGLPPAALLPVFMRPVLRHLTVRRKLVESMLIVGNGRLAEKLHQALAVCHATPGQQRTSGLLHFPGSLAESGCLTDFSQLPEILRRERISRVIVAEEDPQSRTRLAAALVAPRLSGLRVSEAVDYYEHVFGKIWIDALTAEWFVYTRGFRRSRVGILVKRCFDVFLALLLLVLAAPLLPLVAIAIKLGSAGPLLFRQVRVGLNGKTFVIFKFRSMRQDAECNAGPAWAKACDERATPIGRLLRRFHLDEIPQAINVLRGEMSFVGPRPERPYFVDRLAQEIPYYNLRHYVKPGITGLAQVKYRYGASVEDAVEKLQYDLYYAKHWSYLSDAGILLQTVDLMLFGKGR